MAVGIPVVAFDIPPVREASVDGRYARLVPVGDVAALAAELTARLGADKEVDTEAREWVRKHHDMQRIASLVEGLLREPTSVIPAAG
jgi:glycosyltransferase involved in cell wall biosynthesis